jgi:hypothetical protein
VYPDIGVSPHIGVCPNIWVYPEYWVMWPRRRNIEMTLQAQPMSLIWSTSNVIGRIAIDIVLGYLGMHP